jgi:hypothetical protein
MLTDYPDFIEKLDRFRPRYSEQYQLPFDYEPEADDGHWIVTKRPPTEAAYILYGSTGMSHEAQ